MNTLTDSEVKALTILNVDYLEGIPARGFAHKMWPDSKGWNKVSRSGVRGQGMWLSAGSYLQKLRNKGLVTVDIPHDQQLFRVSYEGRKLLREV